MSRKSDGVLADWLDNRWAYSTTSTNATPTADLTTGYNYGGKDEIHLDFLHIVILNKNSTQNTLTASVRDSSVAGTVLWSAPLMIGATTVTQVNPSGIALKAQDGKSLFVTLDTVAASVTVAVNAAGWIDQSTNQ